MNRNSTISIVAPRNNYSVDRKHTRLDYKIGFEYKLDLLHSVSQMLPLPPNPCSVDMDWTSKKTL